MKEDLLHYVWRTRNFNLKNLRGSLGEQIEVLNFGLWNHGSGPDFLQANILIDGIHWSGNVEMHLTSSDWYRHQHQLDPAYDNVILHVVWEEDKPVYRSDGSRISTLILKDKINSGIQANYQYLQITDTWIPCEKIIFQTDVLTKINCLDRMLTERIEKRSVFFNDIHKDNQGDTEETFYQLIARSYGLKENQDAFQMLARSIPLNMLSRYSGQPELIEAAMFGQAGFINLQRPRTPYEKQLADNYRFLQDKHSLEPLMPAIWKYGKIRPQASPHLRLAQLAALINRHPRLFAAFLDSKSIAIMLNLFDVPVSTFWRTHFYLDTETCNATNRSIGKSAAELMLINTVLPFLFYYNSERGRDDLIQKSLQFFQHLPAEKNSIIKRWIKLDIPVESAAHTQALLHLKQNYCNKRACLNCPIGAKLILR